MHEKRTKQLEYSRSISCTQKEVVAETKNTAEFAGEKLQATKMQENSAKPTIAMDKADSFCAKLH